MTSVGLAGAAQSPAPSARAGRWVQAEADTPYPFVLQIDADDTVRLFIPAPQFSATYRIDGAKVIATAGDGSVQTFTLKDGVLVQNESAKLTRVARPDAPADSSDPRGTWAATGPRPMGMFMTLRSDSQVILEVSTEAATKIEGDTLKLHDQTFTVRFAKDELFLDGNGKSRRFVRRPWGCFGLPSDAKAAECK